MDYGYDIYELYDSETGDYVSPADLGLDEAEYHQLVVESCQLDGEGHVRCGERRVYAA